MRGCEMIAGYRCRVYDRGAKWEDRISTVLLDEKLSDGSIPVLGCGKYIQRYGTGVSLWEFTDERHFWHRGRRIAFSTLPKQTREHIIERLSEDDESEDED